MLQEEQDAEEMRAACKARLLRLLNTRERCESELRFKLSSDGYPSELIDELLSWALDCNLVSDQRFAEAYIAGKKNLGWGRERIERELQARDINPSTLDGYPDSFFNEEDELARAFGQASRVYQGKQDQRQAVYKRLLSKGFSTSVAFRVASEYSHSDI